MGPVVGAAAKAKGEAAEGSSCSDRIAERPQHMAFFVVVGFCCKLISIDANRSRDTQRQAIKATMPQFRMAAAAGKRAFFASAGMCMPLNAIDRISLQCSLTFDR